MSLQLLGRFSRWLQQGAEARKAAWAGGAPPPPPEREGGAGEPCGWALAASPEELALAWHDADWLGSAVRAELAHAVNERLEGVALRPATRTDALAALDEAASALEAAGALLAGSVADSLVERCCEVLKQLRGITATYRMTNKPPPTRHSHFVPGILGPLKARPPSFFSSAAAAAWIDTTPSRAPLALLFLAQPFFIAGLFGHRARRAALGLWRSACQQKGRRHGCGGGPHLRAVRFEGHSCVGPSLRADSAHHYVACLWCSARRYEEMSRELAATVRRTESSLKVCLCDAPGSLSLLPGGKFCGSSVARC